MQHSVAIAAHLRKLAHPQSVGMVRCHPQYHAEQAAQLHLGADLKVQMHTALS
jgi:hypothetical protein